MEKHDLNQNGIDDRCETVKFNVVLFISAFLVIASIAGFVTTTYFPPSSHIGETPSASLNRERNNNWWSVCFFSGVGGLGIAKKTKIKN
ncbi:hypothetical protein [Crocosphaera sp.]|uniref:hypothetical protein n=1 Tax=Crocosphaera sp. TaxID=2729996 RepID=UPI002610362D|nr:hypothetical protein [Crocosphaera sp.]MDJ0579093.1 hypothetical protein [Crocosphaera sp.]